MWEGRKEGPCTASRRGTGELRWGDGLRPCRGRGLAGGVLWWGITLGFRSHGSWSRAAREKRDEDDGDEEEGGGGDHPLEIVHLLEQQETREPTHSQWKVFILQFHRHLISS